MRLYAKLAFAAFMIGVAQPVYADQGNLYDVRGFFFPWGDFAGPAAIPGNLVFSPDGSYAYATREADYAVAVVSRDAVGGALTPIQEITNQFQTPWQHGSADAARSAD